MLKKILSSVVLLAAVNASAGENYFSDEWDAKGLIAIEGAGGSVNISGNNLAKSPVVNKDENTGFSTVALKLGGESKHYRLFVSGTYYFLNAPDTSKSTAVALGLQVDYLIRAGEHFNIFLGLNGGGLYSDLQSKNNPSQFYQDTADGYLGAQAGFNIDIIDNLGIELGGRFKHVFAEQDIYSINDEYEGYAALVFKFTGDY